MTPESKIFGIGVRSFCALFIVCVSTLIFAWMAAETKDDSNLMILATSALSFLYGKAAGQDESKKPTPPTP